MTLTGHGLTDGAATFCEMKVSSVYPSEWLAETTVLAYGVRIGVRSNNREVLARLIEHLPPLWKHSTASTVDRFFSLRVSRNTHSFFENSDLIIKSRSLRKVLDGFATRVKQYVAEMARNRVFVHAGAVGWKRKAIIIPGRSMSGKTSLVRELVRAGATYYSDEYAVLDMRGRVHPYPQPLAVRKPGSFLQTNHLVEDLGGTRGETPLPVGLVIVSRYQNDARWRPRLLSGGQGVLEVLANTVPARRKPEVVMPTLQLAISSATVLKGARGEASQIAGLILDRMQNDGAGNDR